MIRTSCFAATLAAAVLLNAPAALANGWFESRPWQFQTSADRANNALLLDMIERKRGGFYDGFSTTITNYNTLPELPRTRKFMSKASLG